MIHGDHSVVPYRQKTEMSIYWIWHRSLLPYPYTTEFTFGNFLQDCFLPSFYGGASPSNAILTPPILLRFTAIFHRDTLYLHQVVFICSDRRLLLVFQIICWYRKHRITVFFGLSSFQSFYFMKTHLRLIFMFFTSNLSLTEILILVFEKCSH